MTLPGSTYRLQLTPDFTLSAARRLADYLDGLGVTHVYLSPVFEARRRSRHGYDVVDPTRVRAELGGRRALESLAGALERRGMRIVLDIVPNHMAVSEENPWLRDVFARGRASRYASFFDIDWDAGGGEVILPVLAEDVPDRVDGAARRVFWKTGRRRVNYRRFFDIDDLIGVRVEDPEVFEATHALVFELVDAGIVHGLRVDHVDGLRDPAGYLRQLRERVGKDTYLVVEKILAPGESLRAWPVDGTTGYDFTNAVNGLFVEPWGADALQGLHGGRGFEERVYRVKKQVLRDTFAGEVDRLVARRWPDTAVATALRRAVVEVTACLGVYRTYIRGARVTDADRRTIRAALREARRRADVDTRELAKSLLMARRGREERRRDGEFVARWQQLSGAVMAKGLEDTVLYRYNRLVSVNEVGSGKHPPSSGDFHRLCARRKGSMNATSTHDNKRSEDTRSRIDVLSEMPEDWSRLTRTAGRFLHGPDRSLSHLFLQSLAGAWPLDPRRTDALRARMVAYMTKAAREAGRHTGWTEPDEAFESELEAMVERAFAPGFQGSFRPLQEKVAFYGALNALSQLTLKLCAPGVPDIYRGTELWDFSLVDPDNRRPVDFARRRRMLRGLDGADPVKLLESWADGRIKMWLTHTGLHLRRQRRALFTRGNYAPVIASGRGRRHTVAFTRRHGERWVLAVATRFAARLVEPGEFPVGAVWEGSRVNLPRVAPARWRNALTGRRHTQPLDLAAVLGDLPFAILLSA